MKSSEVFCLTEVALSKNPNVGSSFVQLPLSIEVDPKKCVNCHACISACPVKYCNNGSGDYVTVDTNSCIACGRCLKACTHNARYYKDDFQSFLTDLSAGVPIVAIVAPSAASSFPGKLPNLIGWLKHIGVRAVFDVSFGAELTSFSLVKKLKEKKSGEPLIASPCPSIVTYIQIYHPELLPYLADIASPMIHTMRMIRRFFPEYKDCRIASISPCIAKKREFFLQGIGDYNIGYKSIQSHFEDSSDNLAVYPPERFLGVPAANAVIYPMPGGLMETVKLLYPDFKGKIRRIEGTELLYSYLSTLYEAMRDGVAPALIDCLSCEYGCNSGPLTLFSDFTPDEIENWIAKRKEEQIAFYKRGQSEIAVARLLEKLEAYWEDGLYIVKHKDLSVNNTIKIPLENEKWEIFKKMYKFTPQDCHNCTSCGYYSCEGMATAIYNQKNKPENCHFYLAKKVEFSNKELVEREKRLSTFLNTSKEGFVELDNDLRIKSLNPEMCKIIGRTNEEIVGKQMTDFTNKEGRIEFQRQKEILKQGRKSSFELAIFRPNGTMVYCLVSATPLVEESGMRIGSFALVTDITNIKKTMEELEELKNNLEKKVEERTKQLIEANKELESFSYSVSHDLRSPLRSIDGFSQALLEDYMDMLPEDGKEYLRRIRAATTKMGHLIDDILSLSRVTRHVLRSEEVNLSKIAEQVLNDLAESYPDRKVAVEIQDNLIVRGDSHLLEIALKNLLDNAWKFTSKTQDAKISFGCREENGERIYFVKDNGAGFDMKYSSKLFGVFQRLHDVSEFSGTGIGLSIVKKIIEKHGGRISATGSPGEGACFSFTLNFNENNMEVLNE